MRRLARWLCVPALSFWLAACAARSAVDPRPIAEDPVCRYNRDLGCVKVRVDGDTPRAVYQGVTYYFCRASCRETFEEEPARYLR